MISKIGISSSEPSTVLPTPFTAWHKSQPTYKHLDSVDASEIGPAPANHTIFMKPS